MSFVKIDNTYYNLGKIKKATLWEDYEYTRGIPNLNYDPEFKHTEDNPWSFDGCHEKKCPCLKNISEKRVSDMIHLEFFRVLKEEHPEEYHVVLEYLKHNAI